MRHDVTMTTSMAFTGRSFLLRLSVAATIIVFSTVISKAGGPKSVAGTSYFDPTVTGQALIWPQGTITYFTDQGDLSPVLPNSAANSFVADAFSQWTSAPTAALTATSGGQLAEDVNGTNVYRNSDGTISMPADIQSTAIGTPVGVVYDYDGSVTSVLLGSGAGDASQCFANAAFGGDDNYGSFATYQHALIVINGQCAQQSSQLVDVEYRLVRVIGGVLGMGWSELNTNVLSGTPPPTADDYAGFPVMHDSDPLSCVPITLCYASPYQLSMDDVAAVSRLYPVTAQNQSNFPGKQVFSAVTARVHGSVWFTDRFGNRTQPMQGVNVVARLVDPTTKLPSRRYAASSVSGFLFSGNSGNPITGLNDALGDPYSDWGSTAPAVEGFFDLAGLQFPKGSTAQYQLSVEPIDTTWSTGVGPYAPMQVAPSGQWQPVVVTVTAGQDVPQDILMLADAQPLPSPPTETWTAPAPVPSSGSLAGSLGSFGAMPYFVLPAQANRTLSVAVTALDESGSPSQTKTQPVVGMWLASDAQGTVPGALTTSPFNVVPFGTTRLDAQIGTSGNFLIGISDLRGDGRPDYRYQAHGLYADSVSPARLGVGGGAVTVHGTGFAPGLNVSVGTVAVAPLEIGAGQIVVSVPAFSDGTQSIAIFDPVSGSSTTMTNVLTFGAAASDNIVLVGGGVNSSTPVGTPATNPMMVRVVAADGVTPVGGATIGWNATNSLQLSACNSASSCTVKTDQSGGASTWLTPGAVGTSTVTSTLAPGVYTPVKSVSATVNGTEASTNIGALSPYVWIAQGATVSVPLTARVLSNGSPQNNVKVNFSVVTGSGSLSASSAQTNSSGYASVTLSVTQIAALVQISACVAPSNSPCAAIYANPVSASSLNLQQVAGAGQISSGQAFRPVAVRVTDSASPPDPVLGAIVAFQTTVLRPGGSSSGGGGGDLNTGNPATPVILSVSQSTATSDINGIASLAPSSGGFSPPVEVDVWITAGTSAWLDDPLQVVPAPIPTGRAPVGPDPPSGLMPEEVKRAIGKEDSEEDLR